MAISNEFFFIGNPVPAYKPFGASDRPFSWNAFARWLADERRMAENQDDYDCVEFDECELVTDGDEEVIGSFGKMLDRAPTAEEIQEFNDGKCK